MVPLRTTNSSAACATSAWTYRRRVVPAFLSVSRATARVASHSPRSANVFTAASSLFALRVRRAHVAVDFHERSWPSAHWYSLPLVIYRAFQHAPRGHRTARHRADPSQCTRPVGPRSPAGRSSSPAPLNWGLTTPSSHPSSAQVLHRLHHLHRIAMKAFAPFDPNRTMAVSPAQFRQGLMRLGIEVGRARRSLSRMLLPACKRPLPFRYDSYAPSTVVCRSAAGRPRLCDAAAESELALGSSRCGDAFDHQLRELRAVCPHMIASAPLKKNICALELGHTIIKAQCPLLSDTPLRHCHQHACPVQRDALRRPDAAPGTRPGTRTTDAPARPGIPLLITRLDTARFARTRLRSRQCATRPAAHPRSGSRVSRSARLAASLPTTTTAAATTPSATTATIYSSRTASTSACVRAQPHGTLPAPHAAHGTTGCSLEPTRRRTSLGRGALCVGRCLWRLIALTRLFRCQRSLGHPCSAATGHCHLRTPGDRWHIVNSACHCRHAHFATVPTALVVDHGPTGPGDIAPPRAGGGRKPTRAHARRLSRSRPPAQRLPWGEAVRRGA